MMRKKKLLGVLKQHNAVVFLVVAVLAWQAWAAHQRVKLTLAQTATRQEERISELTTKIKTVEKNQQKHTTERTVRRPDGSSETTRVTDTTSSSAARESSTVTLTAFRDVTVTPPSLGRPDYGLSVGRELGERWSLGGERRLFGEVWMRVEVEDTLWPKHPSLWGRVTYRW